jgi:hypothetical protein
MKIGLVQDPFPQDKKIGQYPQNSGTANGGYTPPKTIPIPAKRLLNFEIKSDEY